MNVNCAGRADLLEFNKLLEQRGVYEKELGDYKAHFSSWKKKQTKDESLGLRTDGASIREQQGKEIMDAIYGKT